ncbi:MAG: hypothetical protein R3E95_14595 [Thiolinea sp.]
MAKLDPNQKKLLLIFSLFLLPLLGAMLWYLFLPSGYRPGHTTNNGELILPVYPVQAFEQNDLQHQSFSGADLEKIWTLVHLLDAPCDEACSKSLYDTRQIRIALGKDIDRVQRVVVAATPELAQNESKMWASHPDLKVLLGNEKGLSAQIHQHTQDPANTVYLIDPMGNLMMKFSPELEPELLMKDLQKLLRLSHIG